MKYAINSLSNEKIMKIIYDDKKEEFSYMITNPKNITSENIKEMKEKLTIINTKMALIWKDILDLIDIVGIENINDIIKLNPQYLIKIKNYLKMGYMGHSGDLCLHFKNIPVYIIKRPQSFRYIFEVSKQYIISYKEIKGKVLNKIESERKYFDDIYSSDNIEILNKDLDYKATINFNNISIPYYQWISIEKTGHVGILPNIVELNKEAILNKLNLIENDDQILINVTFENYKLIEKISDIYPKIKHNGLKTFFENINKHGFIMGIYLTDISVPNIEFKISNEYLKPRELIEQIKNMRKMYFDYRINMLKKQFKTNNFGDIIVDDNGNVLDINPIEKRMMSIISLYTKNNLEKLMISPEMNHIWSIIHTWNLPLIQN